MRLMDVWNGHFRRRRTEKTLFCIPEEADDGVLTRRMREAAVRLSVDGRTRLGLSRAALEELRSLNRQAEALRCGLNDAGTALERLLQDGRLMEACAEQARLDGVRDLPASEGAARIGMVLEALCGRGEVRLTRERLLLAVASFDDVQALEMAELWAVPEAVRVSLCSAWIHAAKAALEIARERRLAERWAEGQNVGLSHRSPAFFEHALRLLAENEDAERHAQLERHLNDGGSSTEQVVQAAHGQSSVVQMRMENIVANKRLIDALDWQLSFEALSAVEAELRYDPSGVYSAMEDDSRAAVRAQVAAIARRMKLGEVTIARHAVSAAQGARHAGEDEARQTVCYWLCDDEGRRQLARRMGASRSAVPALIPDPSGRRSAFGVVILAMVFYALYLIAVPGIWFAALGIPLAWCAATALIGRVYSRFVRPAKLLKLEINRVPDELRTLIVMPVLLSSERRADEICGQMEALGCMEKDENIQYLLLGDFADAEEEHMDGDEGIADCVRRRIREMNARAGRTQYYYLHRGRRFLSADRRWMGRDRKRGALMDLNRLLLGEDGAEDAFQIEGAACERLKRRFRYVLTLDADTRFLPGTVQRLIGTMAHPLNAPRVERGVRRGYAVLQPQMEMTASACANAFVRLFAGRGGLNTYPTSVSNFWQDVTGTGIYGGKGLYDVRAFSEALDGALPEGRILSHDLIEGTLARAALVSDVCFYDGFPATLSGFLRRMHRWTRGDWQLLPVLFSAKRYPPDGRRLSAADRARLLDNLLRSLRAPSLLGLLLQSLWMGQGSGIAMGVAFVYWTAILNPFGDWVWRRATAELAALPMTAACTADAIVRTLWRLAFSGRHLLDWVTSADAEGDPGKQAVTGRVAAILALPGLLVPPSVPAAVALAAMFAVAPEWIRDLEQTPVGSVQPLDSDGVRMLTGLARDVWRFFEGCVDERGSFLPPDNLQVDPDAGTARRTSPTNVGLYLMSCVAAQALDFISEDAMRRRMSETVGSLERMEKWRGHLYNWYDIDSLEPLGPRYVSSVDSGNLAAALLLCASAAQDGALAERMRALAEAMDFAALYDGERNLFRIGMDVERNRLSDAHYDLLASESRILSYVAMMLGAVPLKHWSKLSRAAVHAPGGSALVSWSGTMFEYLMPELFMNAPENSLLGGSERAAIEAQRALGRRRQRPWGVSESGYYAFDMHLNYQYRAFGLRQLSLSGGTPEDVVAPYASLLALFAAPEAVAENVRAMQAAGWRGEFGFYEAADYLHVQDAQPRLVKSYMAHHQGMTLCALCNALADHALSRAFMSIPEARALELLLEERKSPEARSGSRVREKYSPRPPRQGRHGGRAARPEQRVVDAHLLGGAGANALLTADGAVHYQRNGVLASRFSGDLLNRGDGACVHVRLERTAACAILGEEHVHYAPGEAVMSHELGPVRCEMRLCVSPEDGTLIKRIRLKNTSASPETVRVADCVPVALGTAAEMLEHPVFRHLFVESRRVAHGALMLRRRSRSAEEHSPVLMHLVNTPGSIGFETDYEALVGRTGSVMRAGGIRWGMVGHIGTVLNPCSALESVVTIGPGETAELHFAMGLVDEEESERWVKRSFPETVPERAAQLATMQAQAMLGFLGMDDRAHQLLQRLSALLFDGRLAPDEHRGAFAPCRRSALWSLGISGDLPILMMRVERRETMANVKEMIRAHEFYRALGLAVDLVLINEHGNDYDQPVRDGLSDAIAFSHLNDLRGAAGGVHLLEGRSLTAEQRTALQRAAAVDLDAEQDFRLQLRRALAGLDVPQRSVAAMDPGANRLSPLRSADGNGYGGFLEDGRYAINVLPDRVPPAPWSDLLANDHFGALLTERGGGFLWAENSRSDRLTPFANDVLREGWGWMLYLVDEKSHAYFRLLPGDRPMTAFRATFGPTEAVYRFEAEALSGETAVCVRTDASELRIHTTVRSAAGGEFRLVGFVDWLMGANARDAGFVRTWSRDGACYAVGSTEGTGYFAAANARVYTGCSRTAFLGRGSIQTPEGIADCPDRSGGWVLNVPVRLQPDAPLRTEWVIGLAGDAQTAYARVRAFYARPEYDMVRMDALEEWNRRAGCLRVETPDARVNRMANGWLLHQTLTARVRGRTGLYQPGGAYGFRDQLQDMLALLPSEPRRVREHLLRCAAHQFEDGDVMHWWHEPYLGVRTRISDDLVFLPYVTAQYVRWTGDATVLDEKVAYLENVEIEPGREDRFCEMHPGGVKESLHDHCMRAFRRAAATGSHGLILMGGGDWNDGMNRVGAEGRGESIWLTEFLSACASDYAAVSPDGADAAWLTALSERLGAAVEQSGWDGGWYLRAYADSGETLGGADNEFCRIDAISQAWAVMAGLDRQRCAQAMDAAWRQLVDERIGIIRLLTPAFAPEGMDPGYIRGYPEGVRENGAQYTHAACWLLLALIRMGDADRAHRALQMLLPENHSDTPEKAELYRVEPYVLAADVYDGAHPGRGGWTWYTGSAAWLYWGILALLGFEREGGRVRMGALLGDWPEAAAVLRCGKASYRLVCRKDATEVTLDGRRIQGGWIEPIDDGLPHEAVFPPRMPDARIATKIKSARNLQHHTE